MILTLAIQDPGNPRATLSPFVVGERSIAIGRAPECDLVLPDPGNVLSRKHCRIDWDGAGYILSDTSSGGTYVNGRPLSAPHRLAHGDILTVGAFRIGAAITAGTAPAPQRAAARSAQMQTQTMVSPERPQADAVAQLLAAAGLQRDDIALSDAAVLAASGALLRQLVIGLSATLTARSRARKEIGASGGPPADRTNPLLAEPVPQTVLADLLRAGPAVAVPQVNAAFHRAEAHQRATLHAMQGALEKTLEQIAPSAIRVRTKGTDAALWKAYESAFAGATNAPGFLDIFARELAAAYDRLASDAKTT
ncbi:N/A [soil metagenome]